MKKNIIIFLFVVCLLPWQTYGKAVTPQILIQLTIGSKTALVNGKEVTLDVPPLVISGRTMVPLRFIGEAFGSTLLYDAPTRTIKITAPDSAALQKQVESLENEIEILKKQLENQSDEFQSESNPPEITLNNISEQQIISKPTILDLKITDQSPIAFVRTKLGSLVLSEKVGSYGTIDPGKLLSGSYWLMMEAWDAFGNRGEKKIQVIVQNSDTMEPLILKAEGKEMKRQGPPGGGGGGGGEPPGGPGGETMKIASLVLSLDNKSLSMLEITKIEVFDTAGNLKQPRSDGGVIDMVKRQSGMNHILILPEDALSISAINSPMEEGKQLSDVFKGWKISITFFDSLMQKEIVKTLTVN